MTIRAFQSGDLQALRAMAEASGFPYVDLESDALVEAVLVVADEEDKPVMAVAARRLVELYLWCGDGMTPHQKVAAIRLLHGGMVGELKAKGYDGAEATLPPSVSAKFGKRLEKSFGWVKCWPAWCRRF